MLRLIIDLADEGTQAVAARVCRQWSEVALDSLWRHAWLFDLLSLISPLDLFDGFFVSGRLTVLSREKTLNITVIQVFAHPYEPKWERFDYHASRVRSILWDDTDSPPPESDTGTPLSPAVFDSIRSERPCFASHFPRLKKIDWSINWDVTGRQLPMLVGSSLDILELSRTVLMR